MSQGHRGERGEPCGNALEGAKQCSIFGPHWDCPLLALVASKLLVTLQFLVAASLARSARPTHSSVTVSSVWHEGQNVGENVDVFTMCFDDFSALSHFPYGTLATRTVDSTHWMVLDNLPVRHSGSSVLQYTLQFTGIWKILLIVLHYGIILQYCI